jgi:hypothetical protein
MNGNQIDDVSLTPSGHVELLIISDRTAEILTHLASSDSIVNLTYMTIASYVAHNRRRTLGGGAGGHTSNLLWLTAA